MGVVLVLVLVTGVKQSQLLDLSLGLGLEFDKSWKFRFAAFPPLFDIPSIFLLPPANYSFVFYVPELNKKQEQGNCSALCLELFGGFWI